MTHVPVAIDIIACGAIPAENISLPWDILILKYKTIITELNKKGELEVIGLAASSSVALLIGLLENFVTNAVLQNIKAELIVNRTK